MRTTNRILHPRFTLPLVSLAVLTSACVADAEDLGDDGLLVAEEPEEFEEPMDEEEDEDEADDADQAPGASHLVSDPDGWGDPTARIPWQLPGDADLAVKFFTGAGTYDGTRETIWYRLKTRGIYGDWHTLDGLDRDSAAITFIDDARLTLPIEAVQVYVGSSDGVRISVETRNAQGTITSFRPVDQWVKGSTHTLNQDLSWNPPPVDTKDDCFCVSSKACLENWTAGCTWFKIGCGTTCLSYVLTMCYGEEDFSLAPASDGGGITCVEQHPH